MFIFNCFACLEEEKYTIHTQILSEQNISKFIIGIHAPPPPNSNVTFLQKPIFLRPVITCEKSILINDFFQAVDQQLSIFIKKTLKNKMFEKNPGFLKIKVLQYIFVHFTTTYIMISSNTTAFGQDSSFLCGAALFQRIWHFGSKMFSFGKLCLEFEKCFINLARTFLSSHYKNGHYSDLLQPKRMLQCSKKRLIIFEREKTRLYFCIGRAKSIVLF